MRPGWDRQTLHICIPGRPPIKSRVQLARDSINTVFERVAEALHVSVRGMRLLYNGMDVDEVSGFNHLADMGVSEHDELRVAMFFED